MDKACWKVSITARTEHKLMDRHLLSNSPLSTLVLAGCDVSAPQPGMFKQRPDMKHRVRSPRGSGLLCRGKNDH